MYGEEEAISHISSKTFHSSFGGPFVGVATFQKFGRFSVHLELRRNFIVGNSLKADLVMSLTDDPRKRIKLKNDKCLAV